MRIENKMKLDESYASIYTFAKVAQYDMYLNVYINTGAHISTYVYYCDQNI